jgi:hypothetical protein
MRINRNSVFGLGLVVTLLGMLLLSFSGCGAGTKASALSEPFTLNSEYFSLQGYARGYVPGQTYEFKLMVHNKNKEPWQSQYYAYLVDSQGVVLKIAQRPIDLGPDTSMGANLNMELPKDFKEGAYGLALVFPERGSSITTIRVGDDYSQPAGPWPEPGTLPVS